MRATRRNPLITSGDVLGKAGSYWWDTVFAAPSSDDTPTVSVATSGAISGGTSVYPTASYYTDTHFRYDGCAGVYSSGTNLVAPVQPSSASADAYYILVPEFVTSAGCDKVDIKFTMNAAGTYLGLRLIINGRWLTLPVQWYAAAANTVYWIRLTFPTAKVRTIRVEPMYTANFGGVVVPSGETVTRPAQEVRKRLVVVGDSYVSGAGGHTTSDPATNGCSYWETFPRYVAALLECDSILNLGSGGTGWANDASGAKSVFGARVADILAASPHIVIAAGSRNDNTYTAGQVHSAASAALSSLADIPVVEVCGLCDAGSGSGTSPADLNSAVLQATRTAGRSFGDMLGVVTSSDKISDEVHPSVLGAQKLAAAFYTALDRRDIDEVTRSAVASRLAAEVVLTASPAAAAHTGATVTLTATLSSRLAGTVEFSANGVLIGTGTVSAGVATYSTSSLAIDSYLLTARFLPSNPMTTKHATSSAVSYVVDSNLGFVDHFSVDGALSATENGKAYTVSGGSGSAAASGGTAAISWSSGTVYVTADAGSPNGTHSVKVGGTATSIVIPFRWVDVDNFFRLLIQGGQIQLRRVVSGGSTTLATGSSGAWADGDVVSIELAGDTFTVKKNGTAVTGLSDITDSTFDSATKFGIGANAAGATFDDLTFVAA